MADHLSMSFCNQVLTHALVCFGNTILKRHNVQFIWQ